MYAEGAEDFCDMYQIYIDVAIKTKIDANLH